jgi:hypothetical protein
MIVKIKYARIIVMEKDSVLKVFVNVIRGMME